MEWATSATRPVQGLGRPVGVPGYAPEAGSPVSMAMHLHASFSERTASFEAHLAQARRLGVDVLWWTDHDFRVDAHGYREAVRFDGPSEDGSASEMGWEWVEEREGDLALAQTQFVEEPHSPDETGGAMRLRARAAEGSSATLWNHGQAENLRYSTCLADTTVELDVFPYALAEGAVLVIEIASSFHPAREGRPAGRYTVRYEVGEPTADGSRETVQRGLEGDGLTGVVRLTARAKAWRRLELRPVDDIAALWPDLVAGDNSLVHLRLGARSEGSLSDVVVDRLRFRRAERDGRAALELRRRILEAYVAQFPGVRQYEALEVSLTQHLNWFGGDLGMLRYPGQMTRRNFDPALAAAAAQVIHDHGGLVSWNHPMGKMYGPPTKQELAELLVRTDALGCDAVEIGNNPDIEDMAWVWDAAARFGVFVTGTGVSDDHEAEDWTSCKHNYLTHVWSPSVELPDVLGAVRAGRSWFAKTQWRGIFGITAGDEDAMGAAVTTAEARVPVRVIATDLPADAVLEIVTGEVEPDRSRPIVPATVSRTIPAAQVSAAGEGLDLPAGANGSYVRAQLRDATGEIIAATNPMWALPEHTPIQVPDTRRLSAG